MQGTVGAWQRTPFHLAGWTVVGAILTLLTHSIFGAGWLRAALFSMPLALVATPVSTSARYLCTAMPLSPGAFVRVGASVVGAAVVTASVWAALGSGWWLMLARMGESPGQASPWALALALTSLGSAAYLMAVVVNYLFLAYEDAGEAEQRLLRSEIAAREAELRALRAQMDPHFLFNSLNSIATLTTANAEQARAMAQSLADFLRESLTLGAAARISLEREVGLARKYLDIERMRFGRRLEIVTEVAVDACAVPVPALILQPLVENAVRHGIATCVDGGRVVVSARLVGDTAVVVVENPRDIESPVRRGTGLGLDIVRRRLAVSFGDAAAVVVSADDASFRVTVTVPSEETNS